MKRALWLLWLLVVACTSAQPPPRVVPTAKPAPVVAPVQAIVQVRPEPGEAIPPLRLQRLFMPTGYTARLAIDPAKPTFEGDIQIAGTIATATSVIWLHGHRLAVKKATATGSAGVAIELRVTPRGSELLELRSDGAMPPGAWTLALSYAGQIDPVNTTGMFVESSGGAKYIYSQFEAIYARRVFPCLDEPDSKVPWQLTLDVPRGLVAVANTPIMKESDAAGYHRVEFAVTKPLPSYLIAFGVGPFDIVSAGASKSGTPIRIVTFKGRGGETAYAVKTAAKLVDLLEDWFGMPYPYPKLDLLTVPITSGFSAMENPGLILYAESYYMFAGKPSWQRRNEWILGGSHELAHQWFGDYVTPAFWDDIWLNEGFATWMENKITTAFEPSWHGELAQVSIRNGALRADSVVSARRVRQPILTTDDILNAFDGISYSKGASILAMFESYLGRDVFQKGVRAYMAARAFGTATSADFIAAMSKAAGKELAPAFATFLDQAGAPEIEATLACKGTPAIELVQRRFLLAGAPPTTEAKPWIIPICVAYEQAGTRAETCTLLDAPTGTLALPGKSCPRWVMPNVGGHGYYRVHYTQKQVTTLRDEAWPLLTFSERHTLFGDLINDMNAPRPGFHATEPLKTPITLVMSFVPLMLATGNRTLVDDALLPADQLERLVNDDQRTKYEAWNRMTFGPGATKIGFTGKDSDDFDTESLRGRLIDAAARTGRDPELVKQAVELAVRWRDVPEGMRGSVLAIAVDANQDAFDRALAEVRTENNQALRSMLIQALGGVRDAKRYTAALQLTLDPAIDLRESGGILFGSTSEATRAIAEAFYRAHAAEIDRRMPKDEVAGGLFELMGVFTSACDPARRDAIVKEIETRFNGQPGAPRVIAQMTERLDQCITTKLALAPEVRGWLGGVKIPRPAEHVKPAEKRASKPKASPRKPTRP